MCPHNKWQCHKQEFKILVEQLWIHLAFFQKNPWKRPADCSSHFLVWTIDAIFKYQTIVCFKDLCFASSLLLSEMIEIGYWKWNKLKFLLGFYIPTFRQSDAETLLKGALFTYSMSTYGQRCEKWTKLCLKH